ncbi:MAG: hypothetical protein AAF348_11465 [Bacteroidota bacterium]
MIVKKAVLANDCRTVFFVNSAKADLENENEEKTSAKISGTGRATLLFMECPLYNYF